MVMFALVAGFVAGFLVTWVWVDARCEHAYRQGYEDACHDERYVRGLRRDGKIG